MKKNNRPTLAQTNRTLAREWHPTKNAPLTPNQVVAGTHRRAWWICRKGHEWEADIASRNRGNGCPCCARKKLCKENSLQAVNPELAREWHPTRNAPLTPKDVITGSIKKAWWVCGKGHEWEARVFDRTREHGCPYCAGRKAAKDNCLRTVNPKLSREWHPTRNSPLTPKDVTAGTHKKVWWLCGKGHEWDATIAHRSNGRGCPYCSSKRVGEDNCLRTLNPTLARQWHPTKNAPRKPSDVTPGSSKNVWWMCGKGHEWEAIISSRNNGHGCPYCSGRGLTKYNCLQTVNPKLAREWHHVRNAPLTPKEVNAGTHKRAWWICRKGHEWEAQIRGRTRGGTGCPYCAGKRATKEYSLETVGPWLAREWHPTKNASWTPRDVLPYSRREMWWKCKKGHEWREKIINRYKRGGCPVCILRARAPQLFERGACRT